MWDRPQERPQPKGSSSDRTITQSRPNPPSPTAAPSQEPPDSPAAHDTERRPSASDDQTTPSRGSTSWSLDDQLSPDVPDRVFPIRSVVSVDPAHTPSQQSDIGDSFPFPYPRRNVTGRYSIDAQLLQEAHGTAASRQRNSTDGRLSSSSSAYEGSSQGRRRSSISLLEGQRERSNLGQLRVLSDDSSTKSADSVIAASDQARPPSARAGSPTSRRLNGGYDEPGGLLTSRFKHVVTVDGHAVITGRDGDTLQRCEDEPIHIPGAVQGFGVLVALQEEDEGKLVVRIVSENCKQLMGYTPTELFALDSFTDILSEEQADNLLDHVDFIKDEGSDVAATGPEVFTLSIKSTKRKSVKFWCAMHINHANPQLIICEFELEDDHLNPLVPPNTETPGPPEDTLNSDPTPEELLESTQTNSRPLRVLRSARKRKGEAAAMEVFNVMSQVQGQLAAAPNLDAFLKVLVGVVKELTGFHRVMIYQFDQSWNGKVVTELVDPRATKDLYKGLNFPASDIPKQARDLYKVNKVRLLYDRDQETARLVCRTLEDLEDPLDLTHAYLRAMSPIHIKYLANMAVRSSMSISINAFDELWGLIALHAYGSRGTRVSFPIWKMCRLIGQSASRNIERLSYASRLQARKLINTVPTESNPSGYIIASSDDLLKLFDADFGLLSIRNETKILGHLEQSQEALALLAYLRMRKITSVTSSQDVRVDFPDLRYPPGFHTIAGLLVVPLSESGEDFIVFFRKGQTTEVKWAGNPYEKYIKEGTEGYLEPRKSFKMWTEQVTGKCRKWTDDENETAAMVCLVYGKFIEVWRQKEAALQNSELTRLLLANSAHEVRTPLNAIINYLEIALEGSLDQETRDNLSRSHSASKSLIYVINDLLDLTKTEEGVDLIKDEQFDVKVALRQATVVYIGDAERKRIDFQVTEDPQLPDLLIGDQRRIRQAISNITANAIQNTKQGSVKVEMYVVSRGEKHVEIEVSVQDTGVGINNKKLEALFRELEEVQSEPAHHPSEAYVEKNNQLTQCQGSDGKALGLGLAVVARIVRNMNGQLRLKSEPGKGSRFVILFPFDLPDTPAQQRLGTGSQSEGVEGRVASPDPGFSGPQTPPNDEVLLVERSKEVTRRGSVGGGKSLSRKNSADSATSRKSVKSLTSVNNVSTSSSGKTEADRLIEAIQEPLSAPRSHSSDHILTQSPLQEIHRRKAGQCSVRSSPSESTRSERLEQMNGPSKAHGRPPHAKSPGTFEVQDSRNPIRPVKVPDESSAPEIEKHASRVIGEIQDKPGQKQPTTTNVDHLRVLVAEDDPINSKIVQKRLEKAGHEVYLTVNGEECASAYGDRAGYFDVILMDIQMPIVDGLTSTKMIRSFEKSHPSQLRSTGASLKGRVPIFAVSASLMEKERQMYIDAGFDAWILKPINFAGLANLLKGIVDEEKREAALYTPGKWENGGWFHGSQLDIWKADTKPVEGRMPVQEDVASDEMRAGAQTDDPFAAGGAEGRQGAEQLRLEHGEHARRKDGGTTESGVEHENGRGHDGKGETEAPG